MKKRQKNPSLPSKQHKRDKKRKSRIKSLEIFGLFLIFFAILLFISLISYNSQDPSWASVSTSTQKIHNYGGRIGAYIAEALLQFLGLISFFLTLAIGYLGIYAIIPKEDKRLFFKTGGIFFLILILSSLFHMIFQDISWKGAEIYSGGLLGSIFSSFLIQQFNHTGTYVVLFGLLVLFLAFTTRFSLGKIIGLVSTFFHFVFKEVRIRITNYKKEKQRRKMRKKVLDKYSQQQKEVQEKAYKPQKAEKKASLYEPFSGKAIKPALKEGFLFPEMAQKGGYHFPPITLLDPGKEVEKIHKNELYEKKQKIEAKLKEFRVEGEVREYHPGPIITTYEFYPYPGIKVSQVANLSEDLSLALGAESVRIQRIPGKSSLGIEVPNNRREIIKIRDVIESENFIKSPSKLTFALGKTVHGEVYVTDLAIMPHLLIAGATGSGKSIALNTLIASILYKATPEEVKLILIDPKRLEFSLYDGIPHLFCPVVRDPKKASNIFFDAIKKMEDRYRMLHEMKVRNIEQYNQLVKKRAEELDNGKSQEQGLKPLPYVVIIIDELSELMMVGTQEIEYCIARLAQLARAVGIHLVMATQRPSIDVITGTVKNNFSCRIALRVPSKVDSRVIIDTSGAEKLLGRGDLLFMPPNYPRLIRLHCSYISLSEITRLVNFVKAQGKPQYDEKIIKVLKSPAGKVEEEGEKDPLFEKAVELILMTGQASASYLQRKFKLGYARAARIIDQMELEGIVGPSEGSKPREILVEPQTYLEKMEEEE